MYQEQQNVRRTYRRTSFLLSRLAANLGLRGETPLLARFSTPVGEEQGKPRLSVVRNSDFSQTVVGSVTPEHWQFSSDPADATCTREATGDEGKPALRLNLSGKAGKDKVNAMLAQHDVSVREGQWYRISLRAKAEGLDRKSVSLAIQDTQKWTSYIDYLSFSPGRQWRTFQFLVQSNGTAERNTKFQIWFGDVGTLWLADIAMVPVAAPSSEGRWSQGLYLDQPEDWDDPYRFFRW
jgi:hypothetical protein